MFSKLAAEFIGTFWLVLGGCGSAVLAAAFPDVGIGLLGVSFAFGLTVVSGAYAFGPISGGHFNPAVSVGLWAGRPISRRAAVAVHRGASRRRHLRRRRAVLIASGRADFSLAGGFASNGYGAHSPGGYSLAAGLVCEVVMTFMFLVVILGTTHKRAPTGFAGLAIGLALTLIHLISIPGDEHLGQSGPQHRNRAVRRRLGPSTALAVLAGSDDRRRTRRLHIQVAARQGCNARTPRDRTPRCVVGDFAFAGLDCRRVHGGRRKDRAHEPERPASSALDRGGDLPRRVCRTSPAQGVEFMPFGGYRFGGDFFELVADHPADIDGAPAAGLRVECPAVRWASSRSAGHPSECPRIDSDRAAVRGNALAHHVDHVQAGGLRELSGGRVRPFLTGVLGLTRYAAEGATARSASPPAPAAGSSYSRSPISDFGSTAACTRPSSTPT